MGYEGVVEFTDELLFEPRLGDDCDVRFRVVEGFQNFELLVAGLY